jgi:hypothetical protein
MHSVQNIVKIGKTEKNEDSHPWLATNRTFITILTFLVKNKEPRYPYDIFNPNFMQHITKQMSLKCRLQILRGQNFTAKQNSASLEQYLAGEQALSTAETYPLVRIGDDDYELGKPKEGQYYASHENQTVESLNPNFFKFFELDC